MQNSDVIWGKVDLHKDDLIALSDRVFEMPETLYNEYRSAAEHKEGTKALEYCKANYTQNRLFSKEDLATLEKGI